MSRMHTAPWAQWILETPQQEMEMVVFRQHTTYGLGRRAALQHHPTGDLGRGWRTVGGMWTDRIRSYTTTTLTLGPQLR